MKSNRKHLTKKCEVSISEFEDDLGKRYKVTRRLPEMSVSETRVFRDKSEAISLFHATLTPPVSNW